MSIPKQTRFVPLLSAAIISSSLPMTAFAQDQKSDAQYQVKPDGIELAPIVVTATRNKSLAGETPQKVTIITREQIEQQLNVTSDRGQILSNLIPAYSPSRQKLTNSGETFRGRKPLFLVDGVPQSNPLRDASRDSYTIDLSMVERIEIIHGASAEHGLGATGGIINFVTKRPESGALSQHASVSLTSDDDFESDGFGHKLNYRISGIQGNWDYLAAVTQQERGVFYDGEDQRIGVDPIQGDIQDSTSHDLFAKLGYWLDGNQNLEFAINRFELKGNHDYVLVKGDRERGIPTTSRKGDPAGEAPYNEATTARLSYLHSDWFGNEVDAQLYSQRFRAQFGPHPSAFPYQDAEGNDRFDQSRAQSDKLGAKFTLRRDGLLDNRLALTTGLDLLQDETSQELVQTERTYVPETQFRNYAAFLQGDYDLTEALSLHAGVRQEYAKLNVDTYQTLDRKTSVRNDLVTVEGGSPDFNETLLNVGAVYQVTDWAQFFANYSEGFGMPDVGRALRGIDTPDQDVDNLIKLQPIVTENREIGTRLNWDRYSFELSYFESDSDFGERLKEENGTFVGKREKTEIQGIELSGEVALTDYHGLKASYARTEGESDTDGDGRVDKELAGRNIAPDQFKVSWNARWSNKLTTFVQYNHFFSRNFDDHPNLEFDGYGLVDVALAYQAPVGQISLGINNLADETYITYYSQAASSSDNQYFRGQGRALQLGYEIDF